MTCVQIFDAHENQARSYGGAVAPQDLSPPPTKKIPKWSQILCEYAHIVY